jgi:hypothetical protein
MNQKENVQALPTSFRYLIILATILSGWLAGATVERFIVEFPAFRRIDIICWGNYTRHADLGNGIFFYPPLAIVPFFCLVIAVIIIIRYRSSAVYIRPALYISLFLSFMGLFFTFFAAPVMLTVAHMPNNPDLLKNSLDNFYFWSLFRGIAQVLLFFSCLWAFGITMKIASQDEK